MRAPLQRLPAHRDIPPQPQLIVGAAHDPYEQEADRVAQQVMRMPTPPFAATGQSSVERQTPEQNEVARTKPLAAAITPVVQRVSSDPLGSFEPGADFESRLNTSGDGSPLSASTRAFMEPRFGADFSAVRLHTSSEAVQLNHTIGAQAFTHGPNIYLGEGKNDLESNAGKQLLAHELTHVIQQTGIPPSTNGKKEKSSSANIVLAHPPEAQVLARSKLHTDEQLFKMMQKFRSKNDQLTEAQQNKIFWAIKKSTDSDEVAYTFFDYYSGYLGAGHQILLMTSSEEANARKQDRVAETPSGGDTKLRPDAFAMPDEALGPLLLHEFAHTGHHENFIGAYDFEEGQAYGVEYYYAERTGDTARMGKITGIVSTGAIAMASQRPALKENFKITYALMHALDDLTKSASSTLPPLAGKGGEDGRVMAAEFVSDFRDMSKDLSALWEYIRTHLTSFVVPVI